MCYGDSLSLSFGVFSVLMIQFLVFCGCTVMVFIYVMVMCLIDHDSFMYVVVYDCVIVCSCLVCSYSVVSVNGVSCVSSVLV